MFYISSRSLDGGFLFGADWPRTSGAVLARPCWAPVDGICVQCGKHTAGYSLHRVCGVAAGVAGVGVAGATAGILTALVAGPGPDVAGATSPIADVSG